MSNLLITKYKVFLLYIKSMHKLRVCFYNSFYACSSDQSFWSQTYTSDHLLIRLARDVPN
jgi:hypothetical protein